MDGRPAAEGASWRAATNARYRRRIAVLLGGDAWESAAARALSGAQAYRLGTHLEQIEAVYAV